MRLVTLNTAEHKPVVFGAISILLSEFPKLVQNRILKCKQPLGSILNEMKFEHNCHPQQFFSIIPDNTILNALKIPNNKRLFGRINQIFAKNGVKVVDVVEILP